MAPIRTWSGNDILTTARAIIYAVRPYHWKDDFPKVNAVDKDYAEEIRGKWADRLPFLPKGGLKKGANDG
ncbi:MAG: hypothetical protein E2O90_07965 [Alphaproteobacteria bacterium]|nr:MAG: hypothetical protein E2O90_07965 [Alphaproteobacteria bacterium]